MSKAYRLYFFVFIISVATIHGGSFCIADNYEHMTNPDVETYMGIANFDFNQSPTRRYRIIVPALVVVVHSVLGSVLDKVTPETFPGDFSLVMSFVLVNTFIFGLFGVILFKLTKRYVKDDLLANVFALVGILSSRWVLFLTGTPLVDSFYLLMIAVLIYGILDKKSTFIIVSIYLGVWSKESFLFFLPLLLFTERKFWLKYLSHLVVSATLIISFRYFYDLQLGVAISESIENDIAHFRSIPISLRRLFSFHGIYELFSVIGFWNILIVIGMINNWYTQIWNEKYFWFMFVSAIFFQALLSTELARFFLLTSPLLAIMLAIAIQRIVLKYNFFRN